MGNIEAYAAVEAQDIESLAHTVNDRIQAGWQPYGPMVAYSYNDQPWFVQPIVKLTPDE